MTTPKRNVIYLEKFSLKIAKWFNYSLDESGIKQKRSSYQYWNNGPCSLRLLVPPTQLCNFLAANWNTVSLCEHFRALITKPHILPSLLFRRSHIIVTLTFLAFISRPPKLPLTSQHIYSRPHVRHPHVTSPSFHRPYLSAWNNLKCSRHSASFSNFESLQTGVLRP